MNTYYTNPRLFLGVIISGLIAASALAGPGPEFRMWRLARPATPVVQPDKSDTAKATLCGGCSAVTLVKVANRNPMGKGLPTNEMIGSKHSCSNCAGSSTIINGVAKGQIEHGAGCGQLECCG